MPLIRFLPIDVLESRATAVLRQIARYDMHDLTGEFDAERWAHLAELKAIADEVEVLGRSWLEFYAQVTTEVELYETSDDEGEGPER